IVGIEYDNDDKILLLLVTTACEELRDLIITAPSTSSVCVGIGLLMPTLLGTDFTVRALDTVSSLFIKRESSVGKLLLNPFFKSITVIGVLINCLCFFGIYI